MNLRTTSFAAIAISALLVFGNASAAPDRGGDGAPATSEPAALYWKGHAALGEGDWALALRRFTDLERQLRRSEPTVADAAVYWQAYALARAGRTGAAATAVERLRREYPESRWNDDGARLLRRDNAAKGSSSVRGEQAGASLETLMSQPSAQAIPKLVALLQGDHPPQTKKRALFVLSQVDDPGAVTQVVAAARSRDPALRAEAVRLLGVMGAKDEFREVYAAARGNAAKRQALKAMGVAGADRTLAEVALSDSDPAVRGSALRALGVSGNSAVLAKIAGSQTDLQTRREAIRSLGIAGGYRPLLALYPRVTGIPELRDEVLRSLLIAADERVLQVLHRKARTSTERQAVARVLREAGHDTDSEQ